MIYIGIAALISAILIAADILYFERHGYFWSDRFDPKWRWCFDRKRKL